MKKLSGNPRIILLGVAVVLGIIIGIIDSQVTGKGISIVFFILYGLLLTLIVQLFLNHSLKKLVKRFTAEMDIIKSGDFSHLVDSKNYQILNGVSSNVNSVLSDIRALIRSFFDLSLSIIQSSRRVSTTASEAASAVEEISKTIDEIAKGASSQAQEAQQGVEAVGTLSDKINVVFESYNGVMQDTERISELNNAGLSSVSILRQKSEENNEMSKNIIGVVEKLTDTTKEIGKFVESIESIAEQTNLLA